MPCDRQRRRATRVKPPCSRPCGSCPYRKDVPSGVWDESEYDKLPEYDKPTGEQPVGMFMCHQQNGHLCAGWVGVHDMAETMAIRIGVLSERLSLEDFDEVINYTTPVPLFDSGAEAAAHGKAEIYTPGEAATRTIEKIERKHGVAPDGSLRLRS